MRITIPENLSECKVSQYEQLSIVQEENPEEIELQFLKMVQIFCNLKRRDLEDIPVFEMESIGEIITNTLQSQPEFQQRFTHNGVEYGFIPNLNKMSYGEYMDLSTYLQDNRNLSRFMAVCYRPIKDTKMDMYTIQKYKGSDAYAEQMKSAPLDVALAARVFFWTLARDLMMSTQNYLTQEEMERIKKSLVQSKHLTGDGAGIRLSTSSQESSH